jgi:hypothetical protein
MNAIQSLNLFVSNNAVIFLIALYVIVIVFILAFLSYCKRRDQEIPRYYPTDSERIRVHRQKEHRRNMKEYFDSLPTAAEPVQHFKNGEGWIK